MKRLLERINEGEVLVADGAMGTMLIARGLPPGACPEEWNLTRPAVLEEIAALYIEAGADIVETNTFGASPLKLAMYGLEARADEINEAAVAAAREGAGARAYVAGSCGPSGRLLSPHGDADPRDLYKSFAIQIKALVRAGVDVICVETMTDITEAAFAVRAAKAVSPATPVIATMTFEGTPRGFYTVMGVSTREAAEALADVGADVIGSNCGNGIEDMVKVARELRENTDLPLAIQSNAGLPTTVGGELVYTETPEFMAAKVKELLDAGVSIIGGCCGTTPAHIKAIRTAVDGQVAR